MTFHIKKTQLGNSMGNQHPTVVQWRDLQALRRAEMIENYGMVATEEKVIQHFDCDDTSTIIYPINDQKGREFYCGQMKDGLRHGQGLLLWKNGVTYEGEWYHDCIEGQWGTMTWPDSRTYTGSWKKGLMEGVGVMICKSPENGGTIQSFPLPLLLFTPLTTLLNNFLS
jgi:hypothetical protein